MPPKNWSRMTPAERKAAGMPSAEDIAEACARADEIRARRKVESAHLALCQLSAAVTMVMLAESSRTSDWDGIVVSNGQRKYEACDYDLDMRVDRLALYELLGVPR